MQPRWLVILGGAIIFLGCLYASSMANSDPAYFPKIFVPVLVIGFGVGLAVVPLTLAVVAGVGATEIGPLTAVAQVGAVLAEHLPRAADDDNELPDRVIEV